MELIQGEMKNQVDRKKKTQLLTIPVALEWSRKQIQEVFNVSEYSVRKARKICNEKGLISKPDPNRGKKLGQETLDLIAQFYERDDQSRVLPGMKDVVSIGRKQYERKRLILGTLHELYLDFVKEYPHARVGFSKFSSL